MAQIYEFDMPSHLCGMFIGRGGAAIKQLRQKTGVEVLVRPKMLTEEFQLVVLEGSQRQITRALDIIRQKFPKNKFTELDLSPAQPEVPVLQPQLMQLCSLQLNLPDGVSSDVVVSSVVSPNHLFVQQPTHPSFPNLECMNQCMNVCYNQDDSVPPLPRPIEVGIICAAPMYNSWYRAQVVQAYPETDGVDIKYVDYGGYVHVEASTLRQIRSDFTTMPFQSTECYLANVVPPADCAEFAPESAACLEELVQGRLLQAEVVGHEEDGIPYINLYCSDDTRVSRCLSCPRFNAFFYYSSSRSC
ncbi:hypothetical protein CAPTEDRAFT_103276 [Capitella teleta]|uniref:Tudor domain-containing protein n=1 Tax=Capitella teleta TaxID=283909 RepID=R7UNG2_CAPTE|nr:hypothetical protein CAPTEDRAFT_103276 [Capitella teleta]|eukprot:ELU07765.1 hypothetical protein CAPTEDRAFT_103276 [Capitella teleta]